MVVEMVGALCWRVTIGEGLSTIEAVINLVLWRRYTPWDCECPGNWSGGVSFEECTII